MKNSYLKKRSKWRQSGALSVEFAMTLPVLMTILFGAYEFGRANMIRNTAEAAAYEGARVGIVPGATAQDVRDQANFILSTAGIRQSTIQVIPNRITNQTSDVEVIVTVPMTGNSIAPQMFTQRIIFDGRCQLNRELIGFNGF